MRIGHLVIALFAVLSTVGATGQSRSYFWWIATVERSQPATAATSPTFVLLGPQASVDMKWTFKNDEGTDAITVVPATLQSQIKLAITRGATPIGVDLTWATAGSWVASGLAAAVGSAEAVELQPGDWLEWRVSARRADASSWTLGKYECAIDMTSALRTLSSGTGPWRGRAVAQGKLSIVIAEGDSADSLKKVHAIRGAEALVNGQPEAAAEQYRMLLQIDPTDPAGLAGLGLALVAARQFKEGAAVLESVLPSILDKRSLIPETLAYAYMALGDEANAARVLRLVVPESQLTSRLDRLRATAKRSPR